MTSIKIDRKQLEHDLGAPVTDDVLHQIVMIGAEIDDATPIEIVVDISPNRPDLLSQQGFTRALAAFLGIKPGLKTYTTTPSKLKVYVDESVKDIRPYTACAVIRNLKIDDEKLKEIIDIQEKLHTTFCRRRKKAAIGIYPMEHISGNITFTALEPDKIKFRPLESNHMMTATQILTEHPKGKEFAHLLNGLPKYALFLDNKKNVLSMPPIINSHETGKISNSTTEAFLECSGFDFRTCHEVIKIICAALSDMGASIHTVEVIYGKKTEITPDMTPQRQEFYEYYVNRRLGTNIRKEQFAPLLAKMGLGFEEGRIKETCFALIPPYRVDFLHQVDVLEDIAIAYGYDNIVAALPNVATVAGLSTKTKFDAVLRKIVVGMGLLEAKNYHLLARKEQLTIDAIPLSEIVTLKSSVSEEYDSLRRTLLAGMLAMLSRNRVHEYPQSFFEIGSVFAPAPSHVDEATHLCVTLAGDVDYTKIRQITDGVLAALGLNGTYTAHKDERFLSGRCAQLSVDGAVLGVVGEIAPRVLNHMQLATPVAAAEIDVDVLRMIVLKE